MISEITPNIDLGTVQDANLNGLKYNAILNAAQEAPAAFNIPTLHLNIYDGFEIKPHILDTCMDFIRMYDETNQKILVHCMGGISRSPSIIACYLSIKNNWSFDTSLDYVRARRDIVDPAGRIILGIKEYLANG